MNRYLFPLLVVVGFLLSSPCAMAGFMIKKHASVASLQHNMGAEAPVASPRTPVSGHMHLLQGEGDEEEAREKPKRQKKPNTAWKGIASLCCSLFGVMGLSFLATAGMTGTPFVLLIICGIVFGAMGVGRRNKLNGLAMAGLGIAGLITLFFVGFILFWMSV